MKLAPLTPVSTQIDFLVPFAINLLVDISSNMKACNLESKENYFDIVR